MNLKTLKKSLQYQEEPRNRIWAVANWFLEISLWVVRGRLEP